MSRKPYYLYVLHHINDNQLCIDITQNLREALSIKQAFYHLVYYEYFRDKHLAKLKELELRFESRQKQRIFVSKFNPEWANLEHCLIDNCAQTSSGYQKSSVQESKS